MEFVLGIHPLQYADRATARILADLRGAKTMSPLEARALTDALTVKLYDLLTDSQAFSAQVRELQQVYSTALGLLLAHVNQHSGNLHTVGFANEITGIWHSHEALLLRHAAATRLKEEWA